ncbi:right-handed parallel beta-helix repeat-containing protein [Acidaminobacter hydrogenoformans]|uniref:Right handed beta helix region n=1 Tax=Acidaminobacter hydrogenoformans DSM 2784 TaxID=1120920 RepID=A0A1G5RQ17_9FIRM|nr:right-handed parallel beta-helix repeat-containing protein [Acidaminobacter hydrogenoformans]SCZ76094.1 Right handed beta helix region [Acidaminobacter hydrogenoformans DSM 2784]
MNDKREFKPTTFRRKHHKWVLFLVAVLLIVTFLPAYAADTRTSSRLDRIDQFMVSKAAKALNNVGALSPVEKIDTNIQIMAQNIVDRVTKNVTVKVISSTNPNVQGTTIVYGSTSKSGTVTFSLTRNTAYATQSNTVNVPATTMTLTTPPTTTTTTSPTTSTTSPTTTTTSPTTTTTSPTTTTTSPSTTTTTSPTTTTTTSSVSTPIVANAYYVSTSGNDSNAGTASAPWRTIQKAANTVAAGATVYIKGGTYFEAVNVNVSGASGKTITFAAFNGEKVTIDAQSKGIPFNLNRQGYITIIGLSVKNSTYQGIGDMSAASPGNYSLGAHDITILNCDTDTTFASGIGFNSGKNIVIDGCTITNANTGMDQEALTLSSVDGFEIKNNELFKNRKEVIDLKDGSKNGKIYSNYIHSFDDKYQWGCPAIYLDCFGTAQSNIEIYNNTIKDIAGGSPTTGIMISNEVASGGQGMTNINVYGNSIEGTDYGLLIEWANIPEGSQWPLSNMTYRDNTHIGVRYWDARVRVGTGYATNCYLQNNTFANGLNNVAFEKGTGGWTVSGNK